MGKISGKSLVNKYQDFLYPSAEVIAAGRKIPGDQSWYLKSLEVNSSLGPEPDMAVLIYRVDGWTPQQQRKLEGYLKLGQKMEILLGYGEDVSRVFSGYLHQVEAYDFMRGYVEYTLICLDAKGLMKKNSVYQISGAKKVTQILEEIAGDRRYGFLLEKREIARLPEGVNQDCVVRGDTHFDWLCRLAEQLNFEFSCGMGAFVFRKAGTGNGNTLELTSEYGLQSVAMTVSMAGLTGGVSMYGYNRKDERLMGSGGWKKMSHPFTENLEKSLKDFSMAVWNMELETGDQAVELAQAAMDRIQRRCCRMEVLTIGIPELLPGVSAEIGEESAESLSGTIYVEEVCHQLDMEGYRTAARGRRF